VDVRVEEQWFARFPTHDVGEQGEADRQHVLDFHAGDAGEQVGRGCAEVAR
jgi:hypothetical protein